MAELASQPTSVQTIYAWYLDNKLYVNRRYQRKLVWTQEEKQKLISSLIKKYPVPAILLAERDALSGTYEIIDGLQRLHSIVSFIENSFPLEDGRFFDVTAFPTAKAASDAGKFVAKVDSDFISAKELSAILDYPLALSVMRGASDAEINDVFDRINTYGHRLSDQERRQAGIQNEFSDIVRDVACTLRGDSSENVLLLSSMPSISIDLPMSNHGYEVKAEEVFWVNQGILRSTDLRDSLDEQCIADIAACIVGGEIIERSKDALDDIYNKNSAESNRILAALEVYGKDKLADEIKFCIDEIIKVCETKPEIKLRQLLFAKTNTNAFPSVFAVLMIAFYELIVKNTAAISDYEGVKKCLANIANGRISTGRGATSAEERRKNVDTVKGLIGGLFVKSEDVAKSIYQNHSVVDIESLIRRSEIELANYELKQGILSLEQNGSVDKGAVEKIIKTICAIANIGPGSKGKIIIGVTDKKSDADRVKEIDGGTSLTIGKRFVVGVQREAARLNISTEKYYAMIRDSIQNSILSEKLKSSVLSSMDYNNFHGLGIVVITVQSQKELSFYGDEVYSRQGDKTVVAQGAKEVASLAGRFA